MRRALLSDPLLAWFRKALPQVSQTEQEALDAGTVWWDGELFSGKPDWNKLLAYPKPDAHAPKSRRSSMARWKSCAACATTGRSATS